MLAVTVSAGFYDLFVLLLPLNMRSSLLWEPVSICLYFYGFCVDSPASYAEMTLKFSIV